MYQVFDSYLNVETWHTGHYNDDERFLRALAKVVRIEGFSSDSMQDYMLKAKNLNRDNADHHVFVQVINDRAIEAWAIYEFLKLEL